MDRDDRKLTIRAVVIVAFTLSVFVACTTIPSTEDPLVVNTERSLKMSDVAYDALMQWAYANKATLPKGVLDVCEYVRVNHDVLYKGLQASLDAYKAAKTPQNADALRTAQGNLDLLLAKGEGAKATVTGVK